MAGNLKTLERIHQAAKAEFLEKGYQGASLRNIVKSVGMTTGAFYGYYKSKEELFEALAGDHYTYFIDRFERAQKEFAALPKEKQPEAMSEISGLCMLICFTTPMSTWRSPSSFYAVRKGQSFPASLTEWWRLK